MPEMFVAVVVYDNWIVLVDFFEFLQHAFVLEVDAHNQIHHIGCDHLKHCETYFSQEDDDGVYQEG